MNRALVLALVVVAASGLACTEDARPSVLAEAASAALHGAEISHPIPIFRVDDLKKSQAYYRDALGFKVEWEDGEPPDFGAVKRGDAVIFMCQRCQGNGSAWMMVFVRDVDKLYAELKKKGAIVRMPPKNMPWKLREMHVEDPDGNVIRFGGETEH